MDKKIFYAIINIHFMLSFQILSIWQVIKNAVRSKRRKSRSQPPPTFVAEPVTQSNSFVGTEEYIAPVWSMHLCYSYCFNCLILLICQFLHHCKHKVWIVWGVLWEYDAWQLTVRLDSKSDYSIQGVAHKMHGKGWSHHYYCIIMMPVGGK